MVAVSSLVSWPSRGPRTHSAASRSVVPSALVPRSNCSTRRSGTRALGVPSVPGAGRRQPRKGGSTAVGARGPCVRPGPFHSDSHSRDTASVCSADPWPPTSSHGER